MKRFASLLGLLAAVAACSGAPQQPASAPTQQTQQPPLQPWVPTPPVYSLIGDRERLKLTSAQVTSLDSIGVALQAQNSPLIDQVRELQESGGGIRRRPSQQQMDQSRPLTDQIRENNRRAQEGVRALLTAEQQREACAVRPDQREADERRRRSEQAQRANARRSGFGADSMMMASSRRGVWTWCSLPRGQGARADSTARADTTARPTRP